MREKSRIDAPSPRSFHASCVYGPGLIIHGGVNSDQGAKSTSDWNLFDFGLVCWIRIKCVETITVGTFSQNITFI